MKIKFLDLAIHNEEDRVRILEKIDNVLKHGQVILGPEVEQFENRIADYCDISHAVGVSSGTDALFIALKALNIGLGDEVITSSISFVASANAISLTGATPVFADVNNDFNINTKSIERLITEKTKAIMPVHYGGKIADMDEILSLAKKYNLKVVEDASQAFGAKYKNKFAGTMSDIGCISLNPMKILAALGDAGVIVFNDSSLHEKINTLRYNGLNSQRVCEIISTNAKMDTIQASVLQLRLDYVEKLIKRRREIALIYTENLKDIIGCPTENKNCRDVYFTYTILTEKRDELAEYLTNNGIEVKIYHTNLLDEPAYKNHIGECFAAKTLSKMKLAIPCHEFMSDLDILYVLEHINRFYKG